MKIIVRISIILVAALVVVGIAGALNSVGAFSNLEPLGREGFEGGRPFGREFNGPLPTDGARPKFEQDGFQRGGFGRSEGDREERGGASLFDLSGIGRNLLIMTIITIVIVLASRTLKQLRSTRSASPPSAASTV
ncbi:MAG: hypothetical protein HY870_02820 [Chloroflexi bacterium]|nr:hypothetical protein [Chloroflexota bacterium]